MIAEVSGFIGGLVAFAYAVRRFTREQRRRGRWDERGPRYPTDGPLSLSRWNNMGERLEVTGQWIPRPVHRDDDPPVQAKRRRQGRHRRRPAG